MLVGENPGASEDEEGTPFVGRSGALINEILYDLGVDREDIYLTNAVKCFTRKKETTPDNKEIGFCRFYLEEEIKRVRPYVIGVLGNTALKAVLKKSVISKYQNTIQYSDEFKVKVIPSYHPAYVLRNLSERPWIEKALKLIVSESESKKVLQKEQTKTKYLVADSPEKVDKVFRALAESRAFSFDVETSSLHYLSADVLCIQFSWKKGLGVAIPWGMVKNGYRDRLQDLLNTNKIKIGHNAKFDIHVLHAQGFKIKGPIFDTMLAHHLLDENARHGLDDLTLRYTDMGPYWFERDQCLAELVKKNKIKKDDISFSMLPKDVLYLYGAKDADATFRLFELFRVMLKNEDLMGFYKKHTLPIMPIIMEMEYRGIKVDRDKLRELINIYEDKLEKIKSDLYEDEDVLDYQKIRKKAAVKKLVIKYENSKMLKSRYPDGAKSYAKAMLKSGDWQFNFGSPKQLSELFFDHMHIKPIKKTKTGNSTDAAVLSELSKQGVLIASIIVSYRKLAKYISTYLVSVYEKSAYDGRIHTSYLQHATVSGRLASRDPNMQNIPRDAIDFKECFVADDGYVFVKADLAQAEFRCWAHYSNDHDMLYDIAHGLDIHRKTAAAVFGISEEEVTKEQRNMAKTVNFGLMYGRGTKDIAASFQIPESTAITMRDTFFSTYPIAKNWLDEIVKFGHTYGYVKTWFGRKRRLPILLVDTNEDPGVVAEAERQAKNSPIQGQASDMNNGYMVKMLTLARREGIKCYPALTTHDENAFLVKKEHAKKLMKIMKHVVDTGYPDFRCPMELEFKMGDTWGSAKEVEV